MRPTNKLANRLTDQNRSRQAFLSNLAGLPVGQLAASSAISGHALIGYPQVGRWSARLPEDVDRDAAPRIPIATDAQPAWREQFDQAIGDLQRTVFVESAVVAERGEIELELLRLHEPAVRHVVDH